MVEFQSHRTSANRREFILKTAAIAAVIMSGNQARNSIAAANSEIKSQPLPNGTGPLVAIAMDDSWRLWLDEKAQWEHDDVYLPDEVNLAKLDVNAPTGGWAALNGQNGISVTLPGTVEEHYWGQKPLPAANPENPNQVASLDSPYIGVSWWYRNFTPPALNPGERLILSFPGARLRAEVYVNGKLTGYNFITEIPFTADVTDAVAMGKTNQLAVRITNPGGTFSWGDYPLQHWGRYTFPVSHGFGGIDGGVTMAVHGPVCVQDLYIANNPNPHTVVIHAEVVSTGSGYKGPLSLSISRDGRIVWQNNIDIVVPANGRIAISRQVTVSDAELWAIRHPVLYRATARINSMAHSDRATDFGFRWFDADGIGSNAQLELNGRRVFVSSAISWGFWAPNGMFPDKAAVQREVEAVKALGLNCVNTHRHFPKAAVLDGFDRAGLMRYCEPGGGSAIWDETIAHKKPYPNGPIDTSGIGGEPVTFANRYELTKVLAMIKAYRSHPSVIMWSLNNETGANLHDPRIFYAMRKAHALDPSRILVLKSGFGPQGEVLALPYSNELTYGDSATHHDSGWHDNHNESDEGVYQDLDYQNPTNYKCRSVNNKDIAMWGEAGSGNSPDNYAADVQWYRRHHAAGYTRAAAEARLVAYEKFLDKYNFRSAYPTAATLLRQVGARHYFEAAHLLENTRISNANDDIALSGWESTTHDNNSGLVDSLRLLKSDPAPMRQANAPELIVLLARHYVVAKGDTAVVDAYIVNEVNRNGSFTFHCHVAMNGENDRPFFKTSNPVNIAGGDTFSEPLKLNISFDTPYAGPVTLTAFLTLPGSSKKILLRTEPLLVVDANPAPATTTIACADHDGTLIPALQKQLNITGVPLSTASADAETILVSSSGTSRYTWPANRQLNLSHVDGTDDPGLYARQYVGQAGPVARFDGLAHGDIVVELFFAEPQFNQADRRVFDVALNGHTVLHDFDIAATAGGKAGAVVKQFTVSSPDGSLVLSVPRAIKGAVFAAIRITDSRGKTIRAVFRHDNYRDPLGHHWNHVSLMGFDWAKVLPGVLDHVRSGHRLVLLGMDAVDIGEAAKVLAESHVLSYEGSAGLADTPWIGHWYFSRKHWLLNGLPSGCVLDWQYQAAAGGDEFMVDAPGMEVVIGYGKNPGPGLGFGAVVVPLGHGEIVLLAIPGLNPAFIKNNSTGFDPVTAKRLVYNAIVGGSLVNHHAN